MFFFPEKRIRLQLVSDSERSWFSSTMTSPLSSRWKMGDWCFIWECKRFWKAFRVFMNSDICSSTKIPIFYGLFVDVTYIHILTVFKVGQNYKRCLYVADNKGL